MSGISIIQVGEVVPVFMQIVDGATDQYPQAVVRDDQGNLLTTLNLVHEANGLYVPSSPYSMPNEIFIKVTCIVYTDSGHTTESAIYLRDTDIFSLIDPGDYMSDVSALATTAQLAVLELSIRGADGDDLKVLSDQLDDVQTDLDTPGQYKADVSALAIEGNVEGHVINSLDAYDPPTRAEATADKEEILATQEIRKGTITDLTPTTTSFNTNLTEAIDDYWDRGAIRFTSGQNEGLIRKVQDYDALNGRVTLRTALPYIPVTGDEFTIIPLRAFRLNYVDVAKVVDDVYDEQMADHNVVGSFGELLNLLGDLEGGDWKRVGTQMIFYKPGGAEVARFNLFKFDGTPATEDDIEVAERQRV